VQLDLETASSEDKGGYAKALSDQQQQRQREQLAEVVAASDVVITTAAIPGKRSPLLVTAAAVEKMAAGGVIIDLAAERGGNCELAQPDKQIVAHGVTICGPTNLASEIPGHASQLYAKNMTNFIELITKGGELAIDMSDQVIRDTMATHRGQVTSDPIRNILGLPPLDPPEGKPAVEQIAKK
jgi:NAD(P) transhydrogenase subunit alpha